MSFKDLYTRTFKTNSFRNREPVHLTEEWGHMVKFQKVRYRKLLRQMLENCTSSSEFWKFIKSCKKHKAVNVTTRIEWKNTLCNYSVLTLL